METIPVHDKRYITSNTKLAVALATVGVALKQHTPVTRIYDQNNRYSSGGKVSYNFEPQSSANAPTTALCAAYEAGTADEELDALIAALPEPHAVALKRLLPYAMMAFLRKALDNRDRIIEFVKDSAREFVRIEKDGGAFVLISKNALQDIREKLCQ